MGLSFEVDLSGITVLFGLHMAVASIAYSAQWVDFVLFGVTGDARSDRTSAVVQLRDVELDLR